MDLAITILLLSIYNIRPGVLAGGHGEETDQLNNI
jgi:hypothetical protein